MDQVEHNTLRAIDLKRVPVVFLSYDEDNAEQNYRRLLNFSPKALRVHGVKGFDAAHKEAARAAKKFRPHMFHMITVDADNWVSSQEFFDLRLPLSSATWNGVVSWNAYNSVNGLVYGNGGLKLWNIDYAMSMNTHENGVDASTKTDFCYASSYFKCVNLYSHVWYGSPRQAWRAGFREGVKMMLSQGSTLDNPANVQHLTPENRRRALIWYLSAGDPIAQAASDGAVHGSYLSVCDKLEPSVVSDLETLNDMYVSRPSGSEISSQRSRMFELLNVLPVNMEKQWPVVRDLIMGIPTNSDNPLEGIT